MARVSTSAKSLGAFAIHANHRGAARSVNPSGAVGRRFPQLTLQGRLRVYAAQVVSIDRIGSVGALLAAIAAPCCFPLFAAVGTAAGLGALGQYEGVILYIFQGFALLTLAGLALSFRRHRDPAPLIVGALGCANLAYHFYLRGFSSRALRRLFLGLIAASIWNYLRTKRAQAAGPAINHYLSPLRASHRGNDANRRMPFFFGTVAACNARLNRSRAIAACFAVMGLSHVRRCKGRVMLRLKLCHSLDANPSCD